MPVLNSIKINDTMNQENIYWSDLSLLTPPPPSVVGALNGKNITTLMAAFQYETDYK